MKKNAVAYVRISTEEQNVQNQIQFLHNWATARDYHIIEIFEDVAVSGKVSFFQRSGAKAMIEYLKTNLVDAVLTYEVSRIGRTFFETLEAVKTIDQYAPLLPCSPKESFLQTTDKSMRNLLLGILSWISERERDILSERTKAALNRLKDEGVILGRPKTQLDDKQVRDLFEYGCTARQVAQVLGVSKTTLYTHLHEKTGIPRPKKVKVTNPLVQAYMQIPSSDQKEPVE